MRFVYLGSRFTLHASSPRSVALTQLRFTCLAVASSAEDLHLQGRAHAGRTMQKARTGRAFYVLVFIQLFWLRGQDLNLRPLGYEPNELPDCSTPRQKI